MGFPLATHSHFKAAAKPIATMAGSPGRTQPGWSPLFKARGAFFCSRGYWDDYRLLLNWSPSMAFHVNGDRFYCSSMVGWTMVGPCNLFLLCSSPDSYMEAAMTVGTVADPAWLAWLGLTADKAFLLLLHLFATIGHGTQM